MKLIVEILSSQISLKPNETRANSVFELAFAARFGVDGQKGEKGDKGDQGLQGGKGDKGDKGDRGEVGPTGATGAAGRDGQNGATGSPGATGATGRDGTDGTSAYDYAVNSGYMGDEQEFADQLSQLDQMVCSTQITSIQVVSQYPVTQVSGVLYILI